MRVFYQAPIFKTEKSSKTIFAEGLENALLEVTPRARFTI